MNNTYGPWGPSWVYVWGLYPLFIIIYNNKFIMNAGIHWVNKKSLLGLEPNP